MSLIILAMFGYPTFSATDAVTQYYCLVPLVTVHLLYFTEVKPIIEHVYMILSIVIAIVEIASVALAAAYINVLKKKVTAE